MAKCSDFVLNKDLFPGSGKLKTQPYECSDFVALAFNALLISRIYKSLLMCQQGMARQMFGFCCRWVADLAPLAAPITLPSHKCSVFVAMPPILLCFNLLNNIAYPLNLIILNLKFGFCCRAPERDAFAGKNVRILLQISFSCGLSGSFQAIFPGPTAY